MRHEQGSAQATSVNTRDRTIRQHCRCSGILSYMIIRQMEMQGWRAGSLFFFFHSTDLRKKAACYIIFAAV